MARASIIQTNFTSGELSPRIALGRMDISKYSNGVRHAENVILTVQGGALRRPGTRFIAEIKDSGIARLLPFVYNRSQAYVIEAGNKYMRFYRNRTRIGSYEIATPYIADDLPQVTYVQRSDTAFFAHADVFPQRLQRFGDMSWKMEDTPFITQPFSEVGTTPNIALNLSLPNVGPRSATPASAFFLAGDVGRTIRADSGLATITLVTSATNATVNVTSAFPSANLPANTWTLEGTPNSPLKPSSVALPDELIELDSDFASFRSDDVGKYISINDGLVRIITFNAPSKVTAIVLIEVKTDVKAPINAWVLSANAWNQYRGYPRAVTINKQRLYYANSMAFPQTLWASEIRGYLSFRIGVDDDQAFSFEMDGANNSPIMHLSPLRKMAVLTESDAMSLNGGQEKPITPTNIDKNDEASDGANYVRPIKIGNELLHVSPEGLKVRALGYRYDIDGFNSPDRTIFAEHITASGLRELSFEKQDCTLMAPRNDGVMAVCAYDIDQEVTGWGRWITQGAFESVATIPTETAEDTYVIVRRTINGVTKRYLEVLDRSVFLDSAVVASDPAGKTVWTGLGHLEGQSVQVRGDGAYIGAFTVSGGQVELKHAVKDVQIGLAFSARLQLLQPELGSQGTTSQGNPVSVREVIVRVLDTPYVKINGQEIDGRRFDEPVLDLPPPAVSGDLRSLTMSDKIYLTEQIIEGDIPMPFHVLNVIRKLTIND